MLNHDHPTRQACERTGTCVPAYERAAELEREVAALREALGSLQELLAKQIAVPEGDDILCAACGLANDAHTERCPVARGLAIIDAALKHSAQGTFQE